MHATPQLPPALEGQLKGNPTTGLEQDFFNDSKLIRRNRLSPEAVRGASILGSVYLQAELSSAVWNNVGTEL